MFNEQSHPLPPGHEEKHPKIYLVALGVVFILVIIWGLVSLKMENNNLPTQEVSIESALTEQELIEQQLKALAAEDAANQVEVSNEEVQAQLKALAAEDSAGQVEVSNEEVQAQLELLAKEQASLEVR